MNKPFDIEDHFKGNFTKEKECPVIQNAQDYTDAFHYIHGPNEVIMDESGDWNLEIDFNYNNPGSSVIINCEHDPIDVGFATPKIVCRKCDQDL